MYRTSWLVILGVSLFLAASGATRANWVDYGGNPQHTGVAAEALPAPLSVVWKFATNYAKDNTASPIVEGDVIYFVSGDPAEPRDQNNQTSHQRVFAVRADTGELIWKSPSGDQPVTTTYRSTPAVGGGMLYVGANDGNLYALDARTGSQRWKVVTNAPVRSHPLVIFTPDEHTVYFGSNDDYFYAIDALTGDLRWKFHATADISTAATLSPDSPELIYFCSSDGHVYALNRVTGRLKWSGRTNAASGDNSLVAFQNGLFLAAGNQIFSFRNHTGAVDSLIPQSATVAPEGDITCTPVFAPDPKGDPTHPVVFFGDNAGNFYCYQKARLIWKRVWKQKLDGPITAMPVMAGNILFVGANKGFVYALNALDGGLQWQYHLEAPLDLRMSYKYFNVNAPLVVSGQRLLVLADDGTLNAFGPDGIDVAGPVITQPRPARGTALNGLPPLSFSAYLWDAGTGINPATVKLMLDGQELEKSKERYDQHRASTSGVVYDPVQRKITYTTARTATAGQRAEALPNGRHTLKVEATDWKGNASEMEWTFVVDNTLPIRKPATTTQPGTPGYGPGGYGKSPGAPGYGPPGYGNPGGYGNTGAGARPQPRRRPVRGRQPGTTTPGYGAPGTS
jgi:eukaryotic-like serine/threonine-protein kinase